jgi:diaminohydroxyphosphoribosylaminopyrimidine deaminase / 5-amino-6-(5-phosphoribosylamino)uracil reductase
MKAQKLPRRCASEAGETGEPPTVSVSSATHSDDHTAEDVRFMAVALSLGRRGLGRTWPNPAVGAVILNSGIIVGRGWTQVGGRPHAEIEALGRAGEAARGATLYVTLEPCSHHGKTPPCADAIITAGIARVVSALEDPNPKVAGSGHARLRAAGIAVDVGIGAAAARSDHAGHIRRMREGRPQVMLKLAISADGKAGAAGRQPLAITGERVRDRVHLLRAQSDAVMIGIGTALADDPLLTCRLPGMEGYSPVRIVLDSALRLPLGSRLVRTARQTPVWVCTGASGAATQCDALAAAGVEILRAPGQASRLDLSAVLKLLGERGITRLMVEGGPTLAADLVTANLVDDAVLFQSPKAVGDDGIDALEGLPLTALTQSPHLVSVRCGAVGADTYELFERR